MNGDKEDHQSFERIEESLFPHGEGGVVNLSEADETFSLMMGVLQECEGNDGDTTGAKGGKEEQRGEFSFLCHFEPLERRSGCRLHIRRALWVAVFRWAY